MDDDGDVGTVCMYLRYARNGILSLGLLLQGLLQHFLHSLKGMYVSTYLMGMTKEGRGGEGQRYTCTVAGTRIRKVLVYTVRSTCMDITVAKVGDG